MNVKAVLFLLSSKDEVARVLDDQGISYTHWPKMSKNMDVTIVEGLDNLLLAARHHPDSRFAVVDTISQILDAGLPVVDAKEIKPSMWVRQQPSKIREVMKKTKIPNLLRNRLSMVTARRKHKRQD